MLPKGKFSIVKSNDAPTQSDNINVDEVVKNNSDLENSAIVKELTRVKKSVELLVNMKARYVKDGNLSVEEFDKRIGSTFYLLKDKYEAIYKWCLNRDDMELIYRMIDAQIGVAKKELVFSEQSTKFGHELHDIYVKPKIADDESDK
jgi:hypothetical protein